ncbi:MAG: Multidrug resistance protein MdtB [Planctomycetota bacterium]
MNISEICIRRPVFTWVLMLVPVVLGIFSYFSLGVDQFPNVDFPVCTVTTVLPGASVEEIESTITKPLEDIINTVSGIQELRSVSSEGVSVISVQFVLSKNGDIGTQEVRDKVSSILQILPTETETPVIDKFETGTIPVLTLVVSGRRDFREVTEMARRQLKERLETIDGVGNISITGGQTRAINVTVDIDRLAGYGLSIEDVRMALVRQNLEVPGGRIDQGPREVVLRTLGRLNSAEEFANLIIANRQDYPIRIKDIGRAEDTFEEPRSITRLDGQNAVSLVVQKQSGTNTVKVVERLQDRLQQILPSLPSDIKVEVVRDQSRFIVKSIEEVKFHLVLAAVLVSVTILLFIRDWRTTIIATLAIPTSIVPTFMFMSIMGYTIDNITMLGLILAIGIVIDDAVVVHENIFRHMEEDGMDGLTASLIGTKEIALAVMATSLSLIVIFVPIAFMGGIVGRFFSSFGLTVAFAIAMSLFVSFTLTPMLCSRFLKLEGHGHSSSKSGFLWRIIENGYAGILGWCLRYKFIVILLTLGVIGSTPMVGKMMGFALIPRDDQSEFEISITTPEGYSLERTDRLVAEIESKVRKLPEVQNILSTIGLTNTARAVKGQGDVTRASIYVRMTELEERKTETTQFEVQSLAREILLDYPDLRASVNDVSAFQGGRRAQTFQINIGGPDITKLEEYSSKLVKVLGDQGGMTDLDTTLALKKPEFQVSIDREAASDLGIPIATIADSLRVLVGGLPITNFKDGTEQYDVWLRAERKDRQTQEDLYKMTLPSGKAGLVKLSSMATLAQKTGPTEIERLDRQRIVTVLANPDTISLGEATTRAENALASMNMPAAYGQKLTGQADTLKETLFYFVQALVISIVFMYLILAAQFESWTLPVSILMALPVTIPFGLLSMVLWQTPMDIYGLFGLFMLIGIVKKNGILQVDSANQLRAAGMARREAVLVANRTRLRPILMTTLMLVAAMIPIAFGKGPGAGSRASMAKVIIGGQMLSLLLALIVTPVFYEIFDSLVAWLKRKGFRLSVHNPKIDAMIGGHSLETGSQSNPS